MDDLKYPTHVGIIMDGNGRWAVERGLTRSQGHRAGADNLKDLVLYINELGIKYLSVYAFSTENFKRSKAEVDFLMNLFVSLFKSEADIFLKNNIKIIFSGREKPLPKKVLKVMKELTEKSKDNTGLVFNVCLNYGSRAEIVDMTKKLCQLYKEGNISLDDIDEELLMKNMYNDLPPLDYVIRTSGELRLSNFMMYQASYAEFYFPEVLFPDFGVEEFDKALEEFQKRNRRFGGIK